MVCRNLLQKASSLADAGARRGWNDLITKYSGSWLCVRTSILNQMIPVSVHRFPVMRTRWDSPELSAHSNAVEGPKGMNHASREFIGFDSLCWKLTVQRVSCGPCDCGNVLRVHFRHRRKYKFSLEGVENVTEKVFAMVAELCGWVQSALKITVLVRVRSELSLRKWELFCTCEMFENEKTIALIHLTA